MNRLVDTLERKMGRCYISGLMRYIVFGMLGVFLLQWFSPLGYTVWEFLCFDRGMILSGQVWRLVTYIFLPPSSSLIFILLSLYFYYFLGTALENQWGSRRFNLYYLVGILGGILGGFIFGYNTNTYLNMSLFLAFAMLYPEMQINLFFFLPVKVKYIAWVDATLLVYELIISTWPARGCLILSMAPFFLFFGDTLVWRVRQFIRKMRFRVIK